MACANRLPGQGCPGYSSRRAEAHEIARFRPHRRAETLLGSIMMRAMLMGSFCAAALVLPALGQNSQSANLLGAFGNWTAYSTGTGDGITCFAMSRPRATEPKRGL